MKVYSESQEANGDTDDAEEQQEGVLPDLKEGDVLKLLSLDPHQHFTQPPPRFTQATLIKELEENGIGRPSTYAGIISNVLDRKYVMLDDKKALVPTELGFLVTDLLVDSFPDILNVEFTAGLETVLDQIEDGKENKLRALKRFYSSFSKDLKKAEKEMRDVKREETPTDIACDKCGAMMVVKWGRNGQFLACPRYPECKNTKNFTRGSGGEVIEDNGTEVNETCEQCGRPMQLRWGKYGRFLGCSGYPECKNVRPLDKPVDLNIRCPQCQQGSMHQKKSRRGKIFYGCSRYPECNFATWDLPVAEACPKCGNPILVEKVTKRSGRVRSCPQSNCDYKVQLGES